MTRGRWHAEKSRAQTCCARNSKEVEYITLYLEQVQHHLCEE